MLYDGRTRITALLGAGVLLMAGTAGCGGSSDSFKNDPRPPVPTQLTGVIRDDGVTISPDRLPLAPKKGQVPSSKDLDTPIILIISNQTTQSHPVILLGHDSKGKKIEAHVPPINPEDTAQIQQSLPPGVYQITAGTTGAVDPNKTIKPATLTIRPDRETSSGELLLP
ncbi:MAG: hypothetical protein QOJ07_2606 [Thermoleophilaceae bacterium]|nr:hypothetical protein [Thermoleophilaceae bacterium]